MSKTDRGIAVSLGSAFLGYYAHTGFLEGLNEQGIFPGKICGASAGALAASLYAAGMPADQRREFVLDRNLKKAFVDPGFLYRWFPMLFFGQPIGLLNGKHAIKFFEKHLPVSKIEDCPAADLAIAVSTHHPHPGLFQSQEKKEAFYQKGIASGLNLKWHDPSRS